MSAKSPLCLLVRAPGGDVRQFPLGELDLVFGRDESAEIRVDDKKVSRRHAAFSLKRGKARVRDLGSSNGVRVNGARITDSAVFRLGDRVEIGSFELWLEEEEEPRTSLMGAPDEVDPLPPTAALDPAGEPQRLGGAAQAEASGPAASFSTPAPVQLIGLSAPVEGEYFGVFEEAIVGRSEEAELSVPDPSVSRRHARLRFKGGILSLRDLGSANGCFVNGHRVEQTRLVSGDELRCGDVCFRVHFGEAQGTGTGLTLGGGAAPPPPPPRKTGGLRRPLLLLGLSALTGAIALMATLRWATRPEAPSHPVVRASRPHAAEPEPSPAEGPEDAGQPVGEEAAPVSPPFGQAAAREVAISEPERADPPKDSPRDDGLPPPYGPRGEDDLPEDLPLVDADFDFDRFVAARLEALAEAEAAGDAAALQRESRALAEVDPLNPVLIQLPALQQTLRRAARAQERAEQLAREGEDMEAYRVLIAVPDKAPDAAQAHARAAQLKARAVADAVEHGDAAVSARPMEAARSYRFALSLDPASAGALRGITQAEARLRRAGRPYSAYQPGAPAEDPEAVATRDRAQLRAMHGRGVMLEVALVYLRQGAKAAIERAQRAPRRDKVKLKVKLKVLSSLERQGAQVARQLKRAPDRAWRALLRRREDERAILPPGLRSYSDVDLSVGLAQRFAKLGQQAAKDDPEAAFQRWQAALKLNPNNAIAREGIRGLVAAAEQELKATEGSGEACEAAKRITRRTPGDSAVHRQARARALRCR